MVKSDIYEETRNRTGGDIYLGVVGPVRTGKSTFIKKFMEMFVIPNIENESRKDRTKDELPQSAAGKTIMTTEPKFIPNEAVEIKLENNVRMKTRLVDCVGYLVKDSLGYLEGDEPRMVRTPWSKDAMPFSQAAEIGTKKVITDHSTIGLVLTTDGSITDIERASYVEAEEKVVNELKEINKPFTIILNTTHPEDEGTVRLSRELEEKYDAPVIVADVANLEKKDIDTVFEKVLNEFPVTEIGFNLPRWFDVLDFNHWLKQDVINIVKDMFNKDYSIRELNNAVNKIKKDFEIFDDIRVDNAKLEDGTVKINMVINQDNFYRILSEVSNNSVESDADIYSLINEFSKVKVEYDKIKMALEEVRIKGYGIVTPQMDELKLEEPEIVKQGSKYGIKLRASAPSIHIDCINPKCRVA